MEFFRIIVFSFYILFLQYEFSIERVFEGIDKKQTRTINDVPPFLVNVLNILGDILVEDLETKTICGGAVLTKDTILTSVDCVTHLYRELEFERTMIINNANQARGPDIIYVHEDIALIKMDGEFPIKGDIIKINTERVPGNTTCKMFSFINNGLMYLKEFNFTVDTDSKECELRIVNMKGKLCAKKDYPLVDHQLYVGGPIMCLINNEMRLAGIESKLLFENNNEDQNFDIFTDVSYYQTWIKETSLSSILDKREFPSMVIVVLIIGSSISYICFGTIVAKDTVLTAAKCAFDDSGDPYNVDNIGIRYFYEQREDFIDYEEYQVIRIEPHEYYNRTKTPPANDIAYFIIQYENLTKQVDLMQQKDLDGIPCSVFRWIRNSKKYESLFKEMHTSVSVDVYNYTNCKHNFPKQMKNLTDFKKEMLCVSMKAFVNTGLIHKTYYGGPLICRMNDTNRLAGIGSYEMEHDWYSKQKPGVFTNIMYYLQWIKDASWDHSTKYRNAEYAFMALIKDRKASVSCAGFTVKDDYGEISWVIIAGHCLSSLHESEVYSVLIGKVVEWKMKKYAVKKITRHAHYDPSTRPTLNDIACLKIEKGHFDAVSSSDGYISMEKLLDNKICQFVGWGSIQTSIHKNELMHKIQNTSAKILNKLLCSTRLNIHVTEGMICAEVPGDTCEKYSGGILICPPHSSALVGIATYGLGNCSRTTSFPIVFTHLDFYRRWIQNPFYPPTDYPTAKRFPREGSSNNSSSSNTDLNIITKVLLLLLILFSVL